MRGLGQFRNSQQAFARGVKIMRPFVFLVVRHTAYLPWICGKIVDYISGHKQFDSASAISNFKKILSKNISPFGTAKTESENTWICWRWLYKSDKTKDTSKMLRYLLGLIYYSNTIIGKWSNLALLRAQRPWCSRRIFFSFNFLLCPCWLSYDLHWNRKIITITAAR